METELDKLRAFAQLLKDNPDKVEFAFQAVRAYLKSQHCIHYDYCRICDAPMTDKDRALIGPGDFLIVCQEHRKYAQFVQADIIRRQLGIKEKEFFLERMEKEWLTKHE